MLKLFILPELQKFFGAMFIGWDVKMYDPVSLDSYDTL